MKSFSLVILSVLLALNAISIKAESDELTLRNQLLADVFLLKEGVDRLAISAEVLNKRFSNQMDILKSLRDKFINDDSDSGEENGNCNYISGLFNTTLKKQNILESRIFDKLQEMQDEQQTNFEEMLIKHKLNRNCGTQGASSGTLAIFSTTLAEVSEKIDQFEEKISKLEKFDEKINLQHIALDKFTENQMSLLQQINEKLTKNQEQFDKIQREITDLKDLSADFKKTATHPHRKLPMEIILGLTSANVTSFK